jgi:hypothetical protein
MRIARSESEFGIFGRVGGTRDSTVWKRWEKATPLDVKTRIARKEIGRGGGVEDIDRVCVQEGVDGE